MVIDTGLVTLIGLIGLFCFAWSFLFFVALRRINRFVIFVLAVAFACFAVTLGAVAWEDYQQGIARIPAGRRTTNEITQDQYPVLFWALTMVVWFAIAGLLSMSAYLFQTALMQRKQRT